MDILVGERIRELRRLRGMSQTDLGRIVCLTFQQIQKYECGTNRMAVSTLVAVARALRVSTELLIHGVGAEKNPNSDARHRLTMTEQVMLLEAYKELEHPSLRRQAIELLRILGDMRRAPSRAR